MNCDRMNPATEQVRTAAAPLVAEVRGVGREAAATLRAGLAAACREAFNQPAPQRHQRVVATEGEDR